MINYNLSSPDTLDMGELTIFEYLSKGKKILLLSNCIIGNIFASTSSMNLLNEIFQRIINKENPSDIIIIGKILSNIKTDSEQDFLEFINIFSKFSIPIIILPNNEDLEFYSKFQTDFIKIITNNTIQLCFLKGEDKFHIFITHQFSHNFKILPDASYKFISALKYSYNSLFSKFDWLICGNLEPSLLDITSKIASPGYFWQETEGVQYLIIDICDHFSITTNSTIDTIEEIPKLYQDKRGKSCNIN